MSFPFRRRESSPRSEDEYPHNSLSSPSSRFQPIWKSSNSGRRAGLDRKRSLQIIGGVVALVLVITIMSSVFGDRGPRKDPFEIMERTPTTNFFQDYEGGLECRLSSLDLYTPIQPAIEGSKKMSYCPVRSELLLALNGGGRHGFDQPYMPSGCHYKWYTSTEICMIMDRFDSVVFVGDDMVASIYGAFNALLRRNIKLGALEQWRMSDKELDTCACDRQFSNPECTKYFVTSSDEVGKHDSEGGPLSPYACNRVPHMYFPISGIANPDLTTRFRELLEANPHSWKPVPIIHSLGISTSFNWQTATESMDEWLTIADASGRNTPFVWLGPNAAGHLKPPGKIMQEGNNALWHYSLMMGSEARRRGVEHLNFYNLTLQAVSWDGSSYGENVNLVQAMMIINWLARLEST